MLTITRYIDDSGHFVFNDRGCEWPEGAGGGMFFRWMISCRKGVQLGSVLKVSSAMIHCSSHVTRHTSHVTQTGHCGAAQCESFRSFHLWQPRSMLATTCKSHATRHTSHVTRHTSHVTRHTPQIVCFTTTNHGAKVTVGSLALSHSDCLLVTSERQQPVHSL
jgi:hypothetical protein